MRPNIRNLTQAERVKFLAALRIIVGRRCSVNKAGSPIVSDFDLIAASDDEITEALRP